MAGVQTSNITTGSGDLTITPNGGNTLIKSVTTNNPGVTPVAASADGTVKKFIITDLNVKSTLDDADWVVVHDSATGNTVRVPGSEFAAGIPQPPFDDPLPETGSPWVDRDGVLAVKAGGLGSTANLKNAVEFAVNNNTYNQNDKNVTAGSTVKVQWITSKLDAATQGQTVSGTLYTKSGPTPPFEQTWNLTIIKQPTSDFSFIDLVDQKANSVVSSNVTVPKGMTWRSPVTIDGGSLTSIEVSVNGGAWTSSPGYIEAGQPLQVRGTTGPDELTGYTAQVSIGGLQRTWTVTTEVGPPAAAGVITGTWANTSPAGVPDGGYTEAVFKQADWVVNPGTVVSGPDIKYLDYETYVNGNLESSAQQTDPQSLTAFAAFRGVSISNGNTYKVRWQHSNDEAQGGWEEVTGTYSPKVKDLDDAKCASLADAGPLPPKGTEWQGGIYVGSIPDGRHLIAQDLSGDWRVKYTKSGPLDDDMANGHLATYAGRTLGTPNHWSSTKNGYNDWYCQKHSETRDHFKATSDGCNFVYGINPNKMRSQCGQGSCSNNDPFANSGCYNGSSTSNSAGRSYMVSNWQNTDGCSCAGGRGHSDGSGGNKSIFALAFRCLE